MTTSVTGVAVYLQYSSTTLYLVRAFLILLSGTPMYVEQSFVQGAQVVILLLAWSSGLLSFKLGQHAHAAGNSHRYHLFHTLWHIALPLGGLLWIEYTRTLSLQATSGDGALVTLTRAACAISAGVVL